MKKTLLALALIGASATASADSWIYGGASVGQSDLNSEDATTFSIHAGTGILPFIGVEAGYNNFGEFDFGNGTVEASSFYGAIKPSINFGPLQVYAKGGLHFWDQKANANGYQDEDDLDLMWGFGADYAVFGPLSLGANYMNYTIGDNDIGTVSLTASLNFL
ncbi:porin family protein [Vibrio sp. SCSIO 43135]|uniref:Porin family protein n=1 Tax=Vibrio paucivorans TaxID=2829489 RepID=A0A9X3HTD0_9VIBR|nr:MULTISPECIES: outer membrane beta-barrel protein [Vibrio]MCW8335022.1 porin family protein [Vibrio paucivorans]USD42301.1 porin family protein [Vibrio sp. SCSIO 43135]